MLRGVMPYRLTDRVTHLCLEATCVYDEMFLGMVAEATNGDGATVAIELSGCEPRLFRFVDEAAR
jgi:hypothetical protein